MLYLIESGSYSDYQVHTVLEGPDGADVPWLQSIWAFTGVVEPGADVAGAFIAWLSRQPGWHEPASSRVDLDEGVLDRWYVLGHPDPRVDLPCPVTKRHGVDTSHYWQPGRDAGGRLYWRCYYCKEEVVGG